MFNLIIHPILESNSSLKRRTMSYLLESILYFEPRTVYLIINANYLRQYIHSSSEI